MTDGGHRKSILRDQLREYCGLGIYPMHMPGHKRSLAPVPDLPYEWDVTEVEGTDDLHDAEGILKEAMDRTTKLVGSRRTWYLVGGSTCGNLAMLYAAVPFGGEVILARNCHMSVFHAAELLNLKIHWLMPERVPGYEILGSIPREQVEEILLRYPESSAVLVTSPTYEGICSDIGGIAEIVHRHGKILLVDEAHGAHFGLFRDAEERSFFPDSALHLGADLAVQSAHKMLPSLTQTAWLHLGSDRISPNAVEQALSVFETSSPSYLLLASLDGCTGLLREEGRSLFGRWRQHLLNIRKRAPEWENLRILGPEDQKESPEAVFALDPGKILIRDAYGQKSGEELGALLREREKLEPEMCCGPDVLLMTSCADTEDGWERLLAALEHLNTFLKLDRGTRRALEEENQRSCADSREGGICRQQCRKVTTSWTEAAVLPPLTEEKQAVSLTAAAQAALHCRTRRISLEQAEGEISAEYVMAYPPGIPILIPGERISREDIQTIRRVWLEKGRIRRSAPGQILDNPGEIYVL